MVEAHRRRSDIGQGDVAGGAQKEILKPSRYRPVVEYLSVGYRVSERRACRVTRLHRGTYRYSSHKNRWTTLRMRIREIAQTRVRYGYRKIRVLLNREGWGIGKTFGAATVSRGRIGAKTKAETAAPGGGISSRTSSGNGSEPCLEPGFCGGPVDGWTAISRVDDRGCVYQEKLGDGSGAGDERNRRGGSIESTSIETQCAGDDFL
jgi:hypothetical protein